ncbi:MAG: aspartate aminotransferase family protein [Candidatus Adiutrix sp.]|jgi:acetylornithine aminotransferase|nr:aspartate aminotransferase family protein [Candidatus Adiutrix sp.]
MNNRGIIDLAQKHLMRNVGRYDLAFVRGRGMKLWDADGREYLDFLGGIAVCALGHAHEGAARVLSGQAGRLVHVSNYFYNEPMALVAARLAESSGLERAFFGNSGAEANEAALKLARKYSFDRYGPGRHGVITALGSFHGRTFGTISATGQDKVKAGFEPLLPGFTHVPYGDYEALAGAVTAGTCAVMLEPIQGEGGVVTPPPDYLPRVARLCEERDILLILDEVQTGLGRTGRPFAFQHYDLKPHILTLAKALGGGIPCGATLAREEVAAHFTPGCHSTTVGGAPLVMSLALFMVETILAPGFLEEAERVGRYFREGLERLAGEMPLLAREVRGQGLLLGLELDMPAGPVVEMMHGRGFVINAAAPRVLRFVPPLIVTRDDIDLLLPALKESLSEARAGVDT